jgi:type I restriction enzyme M protein
LLFLQTIQRLLKPGGRCGMVVPNGVLFGDGVAAKVKRRLLEECNLHTIVRLPPGVFAPYTAIPTNLLFFDKTGPTKEVWFYEQPLPEGRKNYAKTRPLGFEEFGECQSWWGGRERQGRIETERAWRVSIADIESHNLNLDRKNPNRRDDLSLLPPDQLVSDLLDKQRQIQDLLLEIQAGLTRGSQ